MRTKNSNEIESAERQNVTNETVREFRILPDDDLKGVSGGVRTNGDDPRFQVFLLAMNGAFFEELYYAEVQGKNG